ncbi:MAG: transposase [Planctomycetaceae bacterium]|nr:transposase [Planctomycetaceae bacterium]
MPEQQRFGRYTPLRRDVPPDNNFAERQIRGAVVMRKNSYCNRSEMVNALQQLLKTKKLPTLLQKIQNK